MRTAGFVDVSQRRSETGLAKWRHCSTYIAPVLSGRPGGHKPCSAHCSAPADVVGAPGPRVTEPLMEPPPAVAGVTIFSGRYVPNLKLTISVTDGVVNKRRVPSSLTSMTSDESTIPASSTVVVASNGGCGHVGQLAPCTTTRSFPFVVSNVEKDEACEQFVLEELTQNDAIDGCKTPRTVMGISTSASVRLVLSIEHLIFVRRVGS